MEIKFGGIIFSIVLLFITKIFFESSLGDKKSNSREVASHSTIEINIDEGYNMYMNGTGDKKSDY
jgi:hypothetical protein